MAKIEFEVNVVKSTSGGQAVEIIPKGSLDTDTLEEFKEVMEKLLKKCPIYVVMNCKELKYVNSSGLLSLQKFVSAFDQDGGKLVFCEVGKEFGYVLKVTSFDTIFDIYGDSKEALGGILQ